MMMVLDLVKSWIRELGVDSANSTYEHTAMLGRMALLEFIRRSRGIPDGFFDRSGIHMPTKMQDILVGSDTAPVAILPLGDVDPRVVSEVYRIVREVFGLDGRLLRTRQPWPESFVDSIVSADVALEKLYDPEYLTGCSRVIAVTDYRLRAKHSKTGWVHGYASLNTPVGIITTAQLEFSEKDPDAERPFRNLLKVTIHEIGHTFRLPHCRETGCIMNRVTDDGRLDNLSMTFCVLCAGRIITGTEDGTDPEAFGYV